MIISGFDGMNTAISINAVEFKALMLTLKHASLEARTSAAAEMVKSGFAFTPDDIRAHIDSANIVSRPILKAVFKREDEDEGDPNITSEENDPKVTKAFVM